MDNEEIAVAIGVLQEKVISLSLSMEKGVDGIRKSLEEVKASYAGTVKDINCKIEDRIKFSDANQDRMNSDIVELKSWKKTMEDAKPIEKINKLETKIAIMFAIASLISVIIQFVASKYL